MSFPAMLSYDCAAVQTPAFQKCQNDQRNKTAQPNFHCDSRAFYFKLCKRFHMSYTRSHNPQFQVKT